MNLYQHAKNKAISSICSGSILNLKMLQLDWLRVLAHILMFPKYETCAGAQQTTSIFIIDQIQ